MDTPSDTASELIQRLAEAAAGLLYMSEADYPLTPYRLPGGPIAQLSAEALLRAEGLDPNTPVEETTVDHFFEPALADDSGDPRYDPTRYRALVGLLKAELTDLRALKVGTIDIDVYILGHHASGEWLGLKTHVVET